MSILNCHLPDLIDFDSMGDHELWHTKLKTLVTTIIINCVLKLYF